MLPEALNELGLTFYPVSSDASQKVGTRALARRMFAGELTPREFIFRIHQRYGHELPLTERLAELDDEYDTIDYGDRTVDRSMPRSRPKPVASQPTPTFARTHGRVQLMLTDRPASSR
ncbi:hypothetical protein [Streptomyces sp. NBC_01589]|uniref:hypothetical protein n=1 Tax=unclassified Streptomyces TaxID=2593676 RepID=UPI0038667639